MLTKIPTLILLGTITLIFQGCAEAPSRPSCETYNGEALAACQAEAKCKANKVRYSVGLSTGNAANLGMTTGQSQNTTNYTSCIEEQAAEQKSAELMKK